MSLFSDKPNKIGFCRRLWITAATLTRMSVVLVVIAIIGGRFIAHHEGEWREWKTSARAAYATLAEGINGWKTLLPTVKKEICDTEVAEKMTDTEVSPSVKDEGGKVVKGTTYSVELKKVRPKKKATTNAK